MAPKILTFIFLVHLYTLSYSQSEPINHAKVKWKFDAEAPVRGSALISGDRLYFGNSAGTVFCLDKATSEVLWKYNTGGAINSQPAISKGKLLIVSRDNHVYALDSISGRPNWKFQMQQPTPHTWGWDYYDASPVIYQDHVYVGSGDNNLYKLKLENGQKVWSFSANDKIRATPLIIDDQVYVAGFDGMLYQLNKETGKVIRNFETEGVKYYGEVHGWDRTSIISKPAIKDDILVIGSRDGGLYGINKKDFSQKWRFSYGSSWVGSSPVISGNSIFVGWSDRHYFTANDLQTGEELWHYDCHAYVYSAPVADKDNVYVGSFNGKIYGFDKSNGEVKWEYLTDGAVLSSPILDENTLYIGSDDGNLYAFEEGKRIFKAVYLPREAKENALLADTKVTPYLEARGYERLDSINLAAFMTERINDKTSSVIVFAHMFLPIAVKGKNADESLLKSYMEAGGKVVWLNYFPEYWQINKNMDIVGYDPSYASNLLDIEFDVHMDFGTYYVNSTETGCQWGLPKSFCAMGSSIVTNESIIPFAINEFGRVAAFYKPFGSLPASGFVAFRTWSLMPITKDDLQTIQKIAEFGL